MVNGKTQDLKNQGKLRKAATLEKQETQLTKGNKERADMEKKASAPFQIFIVDPFKWRIKDIKDADSFQVTLKKRLSIEEINNRMMNAFGDL